MTARMNRAAAKNYLVKGLSKGRLTLFNQSTRGGCFSSAQGCFLIASLLICHHSAVPVVGSEACFVMKATISSKPSGSLTQCLSFSAPVYSLLSTSNSINLRNAGCLPAQCDVNERIIRAVE